MTIVVGFTPLREDATSEVQKVSIRTVDFNWYRGDAVFTIHCGHSIQRGHTSLPPYLADFVTR